MPIRTSPRQFNAWYAQQRRKLRLSPIVTAIKRYFSTLDPIQNSHYTLATPITFSGDFEFECEFSTTSTSFQYFTGVAVGFNNFIALRGSSSRIEVRTGGGTTLVFQPPTLTDGKLHSLAVRRSSGVTVAIVDGVTYSEIVAATNTGTLIAELIGQNAASSYFNGIIANTKFTDLSGAPVTTTFTLGNGPLDGDTEVSLEGNNSLTYVFIPAANREEFQLSDDATQWDNISPPVQLLPAVIEIA